MMKTIHTRGHVKADGTLDLRVATELPESDVDVLVVVQPMTDAEWLHRAGPPSRDLRSLAGACADDPLVRGDQGTYETREKLD